MPLIVDIPVEFLGAPYLFTLIRSIKFVPVSNHNSGRLLSLFLFFTEVSIEWRESWTLLYKRALRSSQSQNTYSDMNSPVTSKNFCLRETSKQFIFTVYEAESQHFHGKGSLNVIKKKKISLVQHHCLHSCSLIPQSFHHFQSSWQLSSLHYI